MLKYKVYVGVRSDGDSPCDETIIQILWAMDSGDAVQAACRLVREEQPEKMDRIWSSSWELCPE